MENEYTKQAEKFIADAGLEFRAVLIGSDCPPFCTDMDKQDAPEYVDVDKFPRKTHIHGKHYRCTISRKDRGHFTLDYWNSYADEEFNYVRTHAREVSYKTLDRVLGKRGYSDGSLGVLPMRHKARVPAAYDVLACIQKHDPGTFSDFCSDFGYDEDSRKAENVYQAVVKEWRKVRAFFSDAELELLADIN